jgi:hypothetical protein
VEAPLARARTEFTEPRTSVSGSLGFRPRLLESPAKSSHGSAVEPSTAHFAEERPQSSGAMIEEFRKLSSAQLWIANAKLKKAPAYYEQVSVELVTPRPMLGLPTEMIEGEKWSTAEQF